MAGRIRKMERQDLEKVCTIYKDANKFSQKHNIMKWTLESLRDFPEYHIVYEVEGNVLGAVSCTLCRNQAMIEDIAVDPNLRCRGIGSRLMRRIIAMLKKKGIRKVSVWTHWASARAIPFYYRHGFKMKRVSRTHKIPHVPDDEDIVFLDRAI